MTIRVSSLVTAHEIINTLVLQKSLTTTSKGGVHGAVSDNIFYIIWFDPHHNLYPDKNHGGLKRIIPPSTCCKDRDYEIEHLKNELKIAKGECQFWERFSQEEIRKNK